MWWFSPSENSLYLRDTNNNQQPQRWVPTNYKIRGRNKKFKFSNNTDPPDDLLPTICYQKGASVFFSGTSTYINNELINESITIPESLKWTLPEIKGWHHLHSLKIAFEKGNLIASTDGSFKDKRGVAS